MIRRAAAADADEIAAMWLRSWDAALPTVARAHPDSDVPRYFREQVVGAMAAWVAVDDDRIVGVLALDGDWIAQLYLATDHRGRGLGEAFLALAKTERPDGLQLWTFQVNGPARRFYERHGFVVVELTDGAANEEREPDVRYAWQPAVRNP
jgi:GNAT superfamily N-acetyltransferase